MESHFLLERSIETAALFAVNGLMVDENGSHPVCCLWRVLELSEAGKVEQGRAEQGIASTGTKMMAVIEQSFIETSKSCDLVVGWEEGVSVVQFQERRALETVG